MYREVRLFKVGTKKGDKGAACNLYFNFVFSGKITEKFVSLPI